MKLVWSIKTSARNGSVCVWGLNFKLSRVTDVGGEAAKGTVKRSKPLGRPWQEERKSARKCCLKIDNIRFWRREEQKDESETV